MNVIFFKRLFWGKDFPLARLSGAALLLMASDRLAHALTVTGALVWVYCLLSLALFAGERFFPRQGRRWALAFLSSFIAGIYFLLIWIVSPYCALQTFFVIPLVPLLCISSEIFFKNNTSGLKDTVFTSACEALTYGTLIVIFSLIREPFGFSSLSLPGGSQGIVLLFDGDSQSILPIRIIAGSSGALLLLGYLTGLYRHYKNIYSPEEKE